jgi:hypothetical protein
MNIRLFFGGLIAWESVMILGIGIVILRSGSHVGFQREDVEVFAPILLTGLIVVSLCSLLHRRFAGVSSVLIASGIGVVSLVALGFVWASQARGFELRPGLITASLMLCIPSGIGGGIIGWLFRRRGG